MVYIRQPILLIPAVLLIIYGCLSHHQRIKTDRVELFLKKPDAKEVKIAYSLDRFTPHEAQKSSGSTWVASVPTTSEFRYFYIVDGAVFLPECSYTEEDDFGSKNCVFQPER